MSAQGIEDRGHRSRWSDTCCSETPTAQYIIYNIKIFDLCVVVKSLDFFSTLMGIGREVKLLVSLRPADER
jgi:hypothetical protein